MEQFSEAAKELLGLQGTNQENIVGSPQRPSKPEPYPCRDCGKDGDFFWSSWPAPGEWKRAELCSICEKIRHEKNMLESEKREKIEEKYRVEEERNRWIAALGGVRAYETYTMENFTPTIKIPIKFPENVNLYIHGPTGSGKTHLACAVARTSGKSHDIRTCKPTNIFREIRQAQENVGEESVIQDYITKKILIIDDLGISKDTDFSTQSLYEIIDGRYMSMTGGLIITSNLSLDDLASKLHDDRVASRLAGMCQIITLSGKDRRIKT